MLNIFDRLSQLELEMSCLKRDTKLITEDRQKIIEDCEELVRRFNKLEILSVELQTKKQKYKRKEIQEIIFIVIIAAIAAISFNLLMFPFMIFLL